MTGPLEADLHTHTVSSGHAFATFDELVAAARRAGVSMLGITDHGPSMEGAPHVGFFDMSPRAPRDVESIRVLVGVEANIIDTNGTLDLPPRQLQRQSLVIAGLHGRTPYRGSTSAENTAALVRAMEHTKIHVVAHPYRAAYPVNVREVVHAAVTTKTFLEINLAALTSARDCGELVTIRETQRMVDFARAAGARCVVSSDAHFSHEVGGNTTDLEWAWTALGLDDDIVENSRLAAAGRMHK